ncbi:MAG TPA: cell shape determination protein CcmA [Gammaproteobacteria bacterium]|jgi:cytoskeletal protein CcmA (bactofilin family)|nr:cell shape determination protein CcmA [Gammaproteobacteria bacterium]HCY05480.1 cell shape determination protein CcmA [Gammaproteobacteria bacterium]|tara:strand:+ start:200 stop:601 length:402 start_codon:yes stop_codon:yes gene_type:complete
MKGKSEQAITLIAPGTKVEGDVHFDNQLFVKGEVRGNVVADKPEAKLIVSPEGLVAGEIKAPTVVVNGRVEGDVHATVRLELATGAQVKGDLFYALIEMQLGAQVQGRLVHTEEPPRTDSSVTRLAAEPGHTK